MCPGTGFSSTSALDVLGARVGGGGRSSPEACYLDLAMSVLILSTFFCFSFSSSGLRGVSGSRSMYRSGMRTLSGVESCGETWSPPHALLQPPHLPAPQPHPALPLQDAAAHLLVDIHVIMLGLQLHLAEPGDLLPWSLVGLPAGLLGSQRRLQVGDVYLVDAAVAAHLGWAAESGPHGASVPLPPGSPDHAEVLTSPAQHG